MSPHSESFSEDGHSRSGRSSGTTTPGYTEDEASADGALVAQEEAAKRAAMNYAAATKRNAVVVSSPLAPRDIGALLGTKPAPVAPTVKGVPQVGSLKDLEDYYKLGMNQSWSEICGY